MSTGRPGPIEETQRAQLFARWEAVAVAHAQELATMTDERAREVIASLGAAEAWRERNDRWRFCLIKGAGEALPKLEGLIGLVARRLRPGISR